MTFYEYRPQELFISRGCVFNVLPHVHSQLEILHILEGSMEATVNRQKQILTPGDMSVAFPNVMHSCKTLVWSGTVQLLIFSPAYLPHHNRTLLRHHPISPFIPKDKVHQDVVYTMDSLLRENENPDKSVCSALLNLMMTRILSVLRLEPNHEANAFDLTHKAVGFLLRHYQESITLESAARHLDVSPCKLSRVFTEQLDTTFTRYLRQLRVEKAKELLLTENLPIQDIAMDCGFGTFRSFNRTFAEFCHTTPRQYRRNGQN